MFRSCLLSLLVLCGCSWSSPSPSESPWIRATEDPSDWGPGSFAPPANAPIDRSLVLSVVSVPQPGGDLTLSISGGVPGQLTAVVFSATGPGAGTLCPALLNHHCVALVDTLRTPAVPFDGSGHALITLPVPRSVGPGDRWWFQAAAARAAGMDPNLSDVVLVEAFDLDGDGVPDSGIAPDSGTMGELSSNCGGTDPTVNAYPNTIARFLGQDAMAPHRAEPVLYVGSSSIRRSQTFHTSVPDWHSVQRGLGGARLTEFANRAADWVATYNSRAIVMYAGANDFSAGLTGAEVVADFRCFVERVRGAGQAAPIFYVGLTPNPARWSSWPEMEIANAGIEAIANRNPAVHYIDVATPFLQTGSPPSTVLFDGDQLHLNAVGYALFNSQIRSSLLSVLEPAEDFVASSALGVGERILIDVGPTNPEDGAQTSSPDSNGLHWNNWFNSDGGQPVLAGERLSNLVTTGGGSTDVQMTISGGFLSNGILNGGLVSPDPLLLGDLAVGTATQDYLYVGDLDSPGALAFDGLEPGRSYQLRFFATRDTPAETRATRYDVHGETSESVVLVTSLPTNTSQVAQASVAADRLGRVHVDVKIEQGSFGYLGIVELVAQ